MSTVNTAKDNFARRYGLAKATLVQTVWGNLKQSEFEWCVLRLSDLLYNGRKTVVDKQLDYMTWESETAWRVEYERQDRERAGQAQEQADSKLAAALNNEFVLAHFLVKHRHDVANEKTTAFLDRERAEAAAAHAEAERATFQFLAGEQSAEARDSAASEALVRKMHADEVARLKQIADDETMAMQFHEHRIQPSAPAQIVEEGVDDGEGDWSDEGGYG